MTATAAHEIPTTGASRARWWGGLIVFSGLNLGLCRLGLALTAAPGAVALFWPVAGLITGSLLVTERRRWPALLFAASLPIALFNVSAGQPLAVVAAFAVMNAVAPTLAASITLRLCG